MGKNFMHRWLRPAEKLVPIPFEQLAQQGDAEAQFQLGLKYSSAEGTSRDEIQAAEWFRKAAEQDHGMAQFKLGQMFAAGRGASPDTAQSLFWFRRAAYLGIPGAQFNMGRFCQRASMNGPVADAPEARIAAYVWFELAAAQNFSSAQGAYAQLTFKMTWDEVAEARRRISAWVSEPYLPPQTGVPPSEPEASGWNRSKEFPI
jgi:uncharacterized protein